MFGSRNWESASLKILIEVDAGEIGLKISRAARVDHVLGWTLWRTYQ